MTSTLRDRITAADPAPDPAPYPAPVVDQMIGSIVAERPGPARGRRHGWRYRGVIAGIGIALGAGTAASIAGLLPADQIATPPLSAPIILNGTGPGNVVLPEAPEGALYVHFELACYDTTSCGTPIGWMEADTPAPVLVDRGSFPLTSWSDPIDAQQDKPVLVPGEGLPLTVMDADTHWRLYAIYTDRLELDPAPLSDGRTLGVPSHSSIPNLIPGETIDGEPGWIDYEQLTWEAAPWPGEAGPRPDPIPVYDGDGQTVIGTADVSATYP